MLLYAKQILKFNRYYKDHKSFKKDFARILCNIFTTLSAIPQYLTQYPINFKLHVSTSPLPIIEK